MTSYNPNIHHRRSIRLRGYDYSQSGAYFITICTYQRKCLFGEIVNSQMCLNKIGCIVVFTHSVGAHSCAPLPDALQGMPYRKPRSLSSMIAGFKSAATKRINEIRQTPAIPVWQRNYYEHIIRNEESLHNIRQYIANNPSSWLYDSQNPTNASFK